MSIRFDDDVGRIRDIELAERLGFGRPENIRNLINRLVREKKLSNVLSFFTVKRRADGTAAARPAHVYWLTEKQALKVIAKSETATADAILDEVIDVFFAWRHGHLKPAAGPNVLDAEMRKILTALQAEVAQLRSGVITREQHGQMRGEIRRLATLEAAARRWLTVRAAAAKRQDRKPCRPRTDQACPLGCDQCAGAQRRLPSRRPGDRKRATPRRFGAVERPCCASTHRAAVQVALRCAADGGSGRRRLHGAARSREVSRRERAPVAQVARDR